MCTFDYVELRMGLWMCQCLGEGLWVVCVCVWKGHSSVWEVYHTKNLVSHFVSYSSSLLNIFYSLASLILDSLSPSFSQHSRHFLNSVDIYMMTYTNKLDITSSIFEKTHTTSLVLSYCGIFTCTLTTFSGFWASHRTLLFYLSHMWMTSTKLESNKVSRP